MTVTPHHGPGTPSSGRALALVAASTGTSPGMPAGSPTGTAHGTSPVPCAARPSTGFVHLDGPCRCFVGGPAPEFAPSRPLPTTSPRRHLAVAP